MQAMTVKGIFGFFKALDGHLLSKENRKLLTDLLQELPSTNENFDPNGRHLELVTDK